MIWHPELEILASCSYDNRIKLYKEDGDDDWTCFGTLSSHDSTVWSMSFEKSGKRLASCGDDQTVKIWQEYLPDNQEGLSNSNKLGMKKDATWKCVCTISGYHVRCVYDIDWNKNNGLLATAGGDDSIKIFGEVTALEKAEELNRVLIMIICRLFLNVNLFYSPIIENALTYLMNSNATHYNTFNRYQILC